MHRIKWNHVMKAYTGVGAGALLFLGMASAYAQSPDIVLPGTTTQFDVLTSSEDCTTDAIDTGGIAPQAYCTADADALDGPQLRVIATSGLSTDPDSFFGQSVSSVANLSHSIQIPVPASGPYSQVLPVQIATEVAWSGGAIAAGIDTTLVQVVATFQVRDITDATPESPGLVVASDTFLFERTDADFEIPLNADASALIDLVNTIDIVNISNSSGADVTALLERGRTYRIELEAKCDVQVPIVGFGVCFFSKDLLENISINIPFPNFPALFENDGFSVSDITVAVGSDPLQDLFGTP
jgi:hypothetical protein